MLICYTTTTVVCPMLLLFGSNFVCMYVCVCAVIVCVVVFVTQEIANDLIVWPTIKNTF